MAQLPRRIQGQDIFTGGVEIMVYPCEKDYMCYMCQWKKLKEEIEQTPRYKWESFKIDVQTWFYNKLRKLRVLK